MAHVVDQIVLLVAAFASKCMDWAPFGLSLATTKNMAEVMVVPRGSVATGATEDQGAAVPVGFGLGLVPYQVFPASKRCLAVTYAAGEPFLVSLDVLP